MKLNKKWMVGILSLSLLVMNFVPMNTLNENFGKANQINFSSKEMPTDVSPKAFTPLLSAVLIVVAHTPYATLVNPKRNKINKLSYFSRHNGIDTSIEVDMANLD